MKRSIQNLAFSALSIMLTGMVFSASAKAAEPTLKTASSIHQLRMAELDSRTKGLGTYKGTPLHQRVTTQRDARNKVGDSLSTTSLIVQRQRVLNRNSK